MRGVSRFADHVRVVRQNFFTSFRLAVVVGLVVAVTAGALLLRRGGDGSDGTSTLAGTPAVPVAGSGEEFDGCRLVEHWDAQEILDGSVRPVPKPPEHPAAATCAWEVQDD